MGVGRVYVTECFVKHDWIRIVFYIYDADSEIIRIADA